MLPGCLYPLDLTPGALCLQALLGVLGERGAVYPGILVGVPNQALQFAGRIFCFESFNLTC